ncbi:MAG: GGDEF domain-containing protein [Spirochaetes bacterium]|nr:GGDEF domain-containing protein [Spirochaetota bacterium]
MKSLLNTTDSIKEFIQKFFSSGLNIIEREKLDRLHLSRIQAINMFSFVSLFFIFYYLYNYSSENPDYLDYLKISNGIFDVFLCLALIIYMRITRNVSAGSTVIILYLYIVFLLCVLLGGQSIIFVFLSLIPYTVVYLKGSIKGLKWLIAFSIIYLFIIIIVKNNIINTEYSIEVLGYLFFGFINLGVFAVISVYQIEQGTKIIKSQLKEITAMSRVDYLTKMLNKRVFMEMLDIERKRTIRHNSWIGREAEEISGDDRNQNPDGYQQSVDSMKDHFTTFSVVLIDIDHFKDVNDKYGHIFGDEILRAVGEDMILKILLRENDIIARFGGEEFIVLLPETNAEQAFLVAERIRERISSRTYVYENIKNISITVSIGISEMLLSDINSDDVIKRADIALYNAKKSGRNCTKIYNVVT